VTVVAIHIGPVSSGPLEAVTSARAFAGKGLDGDRNFSPSGVAAGEALTLVEEEAVEDVGLPAGATRRQLTVRGVRLNDLVGKRFKVGEVECLGVELCEPCLHLQELTRPGLIKDLAHRGGLRADILSDGTISVGDAVVTR
jgi:MOSC domain-containing protein YiiM